MEPLRKFCETRMQSCAIDLRQRLFRCRHREKKIASETHEKRLQKYLVSESRGAPNKAVGRPLNKKALKRRPTPNFFQGDALLMFNNTLWFCLPSKERRITADYQMLPPSTLTA